jgi:hypothetical protein
MDVLYKYVNIRVSYYAILELDKEKRGAGREKDAIQIGRKGNPERGAAKDKKESRHIE